MDVCSICMCECGTSIKCNKHHIICNDCVDHMIKFQTTDENIKIFRQNNYDIFCPMCDNTCIPLDTIKKVKSVRKLRRFAKDQKYLDNLQKHAKRKKSRILKKSMLKDTLLNKICVIYKRVAKYCESHTDTTREEIKHMKYIENNILTHHCPHCDAAFYDFDGCLVVQCTCTKLFCGLCEKKLCNDSHIAHSHVRQCNPHFSMYMNFDNYHKHHQNLNKNKIIKYLWQLDNSTIKKILLLCKIRHNISISINDIYDYNLKIFGKMILYWLFVSGLGMTIGHCCVKLCKQCFI
jgi:hypothetical protein